MLVLLTCHPPPPLKCPLWTSVNFPSSFQSLFTEWSINPPGWRNLPWGLRDLNHPKSSILKERFLSFKIFVKRLVHWGEIVRPGFLKSWNATIGVRNLNLCYHSFYCSGVFWYTPEGTVILSCLFHRSENRLVESMLK